MAIGKTALVGSGAVGGYYGAMLAQAGFDIRFLFRSTYESVKANGYGLFIIPRIQRNLRFKTLNLTEGLNR